MNKCDTNGSVDMENTSILMDSDIEKQKDIWRKEQQLIRVSRIVSGIYKWIKKINVFCCLKMSCFFSLFRVGWLLKTAGIGWPVLSCWSVD